MADIGTIKAVSGRKLGQGGVGRGEPTGGMYDVLADNGAIIRNVNAEGNFKLGDKVKIDRKRLVILGKA